MCVHRGSGLQSPLTSSRQRQPQDSKVSTGDTGTRWCRIGAHQDRVRDFFLEQHTYAEPNALQAVLTGP